MKVGEKIVCVNDKFGGCFLPGTKFPLKDEIYTVREIDASGGILLEEIINESYHYHDGYGECNWDPSRFRPIDHSIGEKVCEYITKECEKIKTPELV